MSTTKLYGILTPNTEHNNTKLESVQKHATKMLPDLSIRDFTNSDSLKVLNLPTLMFHRLRGDCVQVFNYLNNYYDIDHNDLFYVNVPIFHYT